MLKLFYKKALYKTYPNSEFDDHLKGPIKNSIDINITFPL